MEDRRAFLDRIDQGMRGLDEASLRETDTARQKAFAIVTSSALRQAVDLTREADKVRERYGRHTLGQSHLLARRLVEAGSHFLISGGSCQTCFGQSHVE